MEVVIDASCAFGGEAVKVMRVVLLFGKTGGKSSSFFVVVLVDALDRSPVNKTRYETALV